ncbi:excalibur calcium-binding domain-containing protein [Brevundimonas naejangsanensis]|uniref:excalibur calcium-binding domain-containing protein n=1 Tax=Brevundimonas naejangsanensis TaxID=588932 RepID=UPI003D063F7C
MRPRTPHKPRRRPPPARRFQLPFLAVVVLTATVAFTLTWLVITPSAPRAAVASYVNVRTTDQHYSGCNAVRAAGRKDIPRWDPSYRSWMDGDGDGLACEPPRGGY